VLLFCACCFICRSYSYMDCLFWFYPRPYVFTFYVTFIPVTVCGVSHWIKGYLTWLDLFTEDTYWNIRRNIWRWNIISLVMLRRPHVPCDRRRTAVCSSWWLDIGVQSTKPGRLLIALGKEYLLLVNCGVAQCEQLCEVVKDVGGVTGIAPLSIEPAAELSLRPVAAFSAGRNPH